MATSALVLLLCYLCPTSGLAKLASYDPVHAANVTPPPGWTIRASKPGELPASQAGITDAVNKEIIIDPEFCFLVGEKWNAGPEGVIAMAVELIEHELEHVDLGNPQGFLGLCDHMDVYERDSNRACERAADSEGGLRAMLCAWANDRSRVYDSWLSHRNDKCPGVKPKRGRCAACP